MKHANLQEFIEYSTERFTKRIIFKEGESTVFALNFKPGQALPTHKHPGTNVYLLVLNGEGTFMIDGNEVKVTKDDVVVCGGESNFSFVAGGEENTSLYVMLNKIPDERYVQNV